MAYTIDGEPFTLTCCACKRHVDDGDREDIGLDVYCEPCATLRRREGDQDD